MPLAAMNQPTPTVSERDVERIVRRDFPAGKVPAVMALLAEYGMSEWHREVPRVRLAALKLADGSLEELRRQIDWAKSDYRDVIAPAEYPSYFRQSFPMRELPEPEARQAIDQDWAQYQAWLKKE